MRPATARELQIRISPAAAVAFLSLERVNLPFNYLACGHLIQYCSHRHLDLQVKQIHARLLVFNVIPDNFIASKLLTFYSRSGNASLARHLFDKIPQKNTFSLNAMLFAYSYNEHHFEAIKLFASVTSSMAVRSDNFTLTSLLKSLSAHSWPFLHPRLGKEIQAFALRQGFETDIFVSNALITFYARAGDLVMAKWIFDAALDKDIVSWNSIISGYSQSGECESCLRMYQEMKNSGLRPNNITVLSVLQACSQLKDLVIGMEVHKFVTENQIDVDQPLWNALVGFYAKCGRLNYARELFDDMAEKDEVTYGAMISGYMSHGYVEEAMALFRSMQKRDTSTWNGVLAGLVQNRRHKAVVEHILQMQADGHRPNSVTLACVLPTFSYFSSLKAGKQMHCYAIRNDLDKNIYVATALIDVYAKCGCINGASFVFSGTRFRSVIVWTAIISAYATHGYVDACLHVFDQMLTSGIHPDSVTFTAVLAACVHGGAVEEARRVFHIMPQYKTTPTVEHYACLAGVLARGGLLHEAVDLVSRMPMEPNAKVWGALLHGASVSGSVEIGKFAFDHLCEIEPENTANHIIMANIFSQARAWSEAEALRQKLATTGMKIFPGYSMA